MTNRSRAILFAAALFAAVSVAYGQVWQVEFIDPEANIFPLSAGGFTSSAGSNVAALAEMTAQHCKGNSWLNSDFKLTLTNPEPRLWDDPQRPRLGFRNFAIDSVTTAGPVQFTRTGELLPGTYQCQYHAVTGATYPACVADFINTSNHPQQYYKEVQIRVHFNDVPFLNMLEDGSKQLWGSVTHPTVDLAIYEKNDCAEPMSAGVGLASYAPDDERYKDDNHTTITRTGTNTWRIDVNQRIPLIVWGFVPQKVTDRKGKTSTACTAYMTTNGAFYTTPVKFSMVWTRVQ